MKPAVVREACKRAVHEDVEAGWEVEEECQPFFSFWFVQGPRPWVGNVHYQSGSCFSIIPFGDALSGMPTGVFHQLR